MMLARDFLTKEQQREITDAIAEAEKNTSGEIRVHVDDSYVQMTPKAIIKLFKKLGMEKTERRNGVLFFISVNTRQFVIIGDTGINSVVPDDFWVSIKDKVVAHFKKDEFVEGLVEGIKCCGEKLKAHFPYQSDDTNELTNEISYGEK